MDCTGFSEGESLASSSALRALLRGRTNAAAGETETGSEELHAMFLEILASAQRAYPAVRVSPEIFATYVLDRLPDASPVLVALPRMHTSDLYLACGCACGDAQAIAAFEDRCLRPLDRVLASMGIDQAACADVTQEIRSRVLVGNIRQGRAEIIDFAGRGDLRGWIRVMAVRLALQRQGRARRELPAEDCELLQQIADPGDPSLAHAKGVYREEFKRAFESALRALPDRQRTLLRQHHVDGLSIDELGRLYRVHRSTAARLLGRARLAVLDATRARMQFQLGVESRDLDSILRLIRSQIDISLRGLRRVRKR